MTLRDVLTCLAVVGISIGLLITFSALHSRGDVERRLVDAHAPVFERFPTLALQLLRHLRCIASGTRYERGRHCEQAFVAFGMIAVLVVPPLLTTQMAEDAKLATHVVALTLGTILWSGVVETPGLLHQRPDLSPAATPLPTLTVILIVLALDAVVSMLALSGLTQGGTMTAFCFGAAFVALPDIGSALLGLIAAVYEL